MSSHRAVITHIHGLLAVASTLSAISYAVEPESEEQITLIRARDAAKVGALAWLRHFTQFTDKKIIPEAPDSKKKLVILQAVSPDLAKAIDALEQLPEGQVKKVTAECLSVLEEAKRAFSAYVENYPQAVADLLADPEGRLSINVHFADILTEDA